jgi:hypothetical protein
MFGEFGRAFGGQGVEDVREWRAGTAYWHCSVTAYILSQ